MDVTSALVEKYTKSEDGPLPRRDGFHKVRKALEFAISEPLKNPRVIILSGLRGVGKTTVLLQLYKDFISKGWSTDEIVYLSMDKAVFSGKNITDLIEEFQERVLFNYLVKSDRKFIFLIDEAHYSPQWDLEIKIIHDEAPNTMFVISGSSALQLGMSPDLARRSISENLFPLNFLEHILIYHRKEPPGDITNAFRDLIFESSDINEIEKKYSDVVKPLNDLLRENDGYAPGTLRRFLFEGGMPWSNVEHMKFSGIAPSGDRYTPLHQMDATAPSASVPAGPRFRERCQAANFEINSNFAPLTTYNSTYDVVGRIIEKDIPLIGDHDTRTLRILPKILGMLAPAPNTSMNSITRDLEGVSITTVKRLIDSLARSQLVFEIVPYGSMKKSLRGGTRKYYASPCLASAVVTEMGFNPNHFLGPLTECAVASVLFKLSRMEPGIQLAYQVGKGHADFVLNYRNNVIVIEVGYGKKEDGFRQVRRTMRETNSRCGLVVSGSRRVELRGNIIKIPLRHFLCL